MECAKRRSQSGRRWASTRWKSRSSPSGRRATETKGPWPRREVSMEEATKKTSEKPNEIIAKYARDIAQKIEEDADDLVTFAMIGVRAKDHGVYFAFGSPKTMSGEEDTTHALVMLGALERAKSMLTGLLEDRMDMSR